MFQALLLDCVDKQNNYIYSQMITIYRTKKYNSFIYDEYWEVVMKRQVFFSFHFGNDIWRVGQIRNIGVVEGQELFSDRIHGQRKVNVHGEQRLIIQYQGQKTMLKR